MNRFLWACSPQLHGLATEDARFTLLTQKRKQVQSEKKTKEKFEFCWQTTFLKFKEFNIGTNIPSHEQAA